MSSQEIHHEAIDTPANRPSGGRHNRRHRGCVLEIQASGRREPSGSRSVILHPPVTGGSPKRSAAATQRRRLPANAAIPRVAPVGHRTSRKITMNEVRPYLLPHTTFEGQIASRAGAVITLRDTSQWSRFVTLLNRCNGRSTLE